MKKTLLLFILLSALHSARAADTLTIRQVFNFNVGDTFDYVIIDYPGFGSPNHTLYKIEISDRWFSTTLDTLYYARTWSAQHLDTISFTHLDSLLPLNDTPQNCHNCYLQLAIDSACNAIRNRIMWGNGLVGVTYTFIEGLGKVQSSVSSDDNSGIDTSLTAYVTNGIYNQTPYFTTSIKDISNMSSIHLYPTPTSEILHLTYPEANQHDTHLIITDLLGQQVYSSPIAHTESTHDISGLPAGIYTWRLITEQGTIKTGKVIKQ